MSSIPQSNTRNLLLSVLPAASFAKIRPHLERVELPVKTVLVEEKTPTLHVHFLEAGIASMVARSQRDGEEIEVGHIGREGMAGFHVALGIASTPHRTFMQVSGQALRLPSDVLTKVLARNVPLRALLLRYIHSYEVQLTQSALANGRYSIKERLARWLLMSHDRLEHDHLPLTHEFLSLMLGVRRSGVTNEIHVLEGKGLIKATRGRIYLLDRSGLETLAGGCYGVPEDEYARLIGTPYRASRDQPDRTRGGEP